MIIAIDIETYEYNNTKKVYEPVLNTNKFLIGCAKTDEGETRFFENNEEMYE